MIRPKAYQLAAKIEDSLNVKCQPLSGGGPHADFGDEWTVMTYGEHPNDDTEVKNYGHAMSVARKRYMKPARPEYEKGGRTMAAAAVAANMSAPYSTDSEGRTYETWADVSAEIYDEEDLAEIRSADPSLVVVA